ncbi:sensor histidine kinase [Natronoflexus pectinivorans]|nr:HAMP domain-containing sensor histidine kinase [Natronoflexus pectinivorans]
MMYAKCLIHLHDEGLAPSVTGAILVIFLVSLDVKENDKLAAVIFGFPILIFTLFLIFINQPSKEEFIVLADVYPIIVLGYIINRIQFRLRFKLFKSNKLLAAEQEKTKTLYAESLLINGELKKRANESMLIKEEIEEKNKELNKMNESKDKFLGIIAHDLKNPISNIWGLSQLLITDKSLDEETKQKCIETINISIKNTHSLLDNLLDWARAQSNSIVFIPKFHNAYEIVESILDVVQYMADKKSISIENNISQSLKIFADQNMLETIIRNLISNAIKYTKINGRIVISANQVQNENKEFVEIRVIDNGIGMSQNQLSELFTISKNISTKGTENEEGTGLGLLLCKEFMDEHNGEIHVKSSLSAGSCFTCLFPSL